MQKFLLSSIDLLSMSPVIYLAGVIYTSAIFQWMRPLITEYKAKTEWKYILFILFNGLLPTIADAFAVDLFNHINPAFVVIGIPVLVVAEFSFITLDSVKTYEFLCCLLMLQLSCMFGLSASLITHVGIGIIDLHSPSLHTSVLSMTLILLAVTTTIFRKFFGRNMKILKKIIHDDVEGATLHAYMLLNGIVLGITTGIDYSIYFSEKDVVEFRSNVLIGMLLRYVLIMITSWVIIFFKCRMEDARQRVEVATKTIHKERRKSAVLEEKTKRDPLTGLFNRTGITSRIDGLIRMNGEDIVHAFFILDLDHFKEINDTFGHPVGDTFLKKASATLTHAFRENDVIGRLGGDEFCVFMTGPVDEEIVCRKAEQLNHAMRFSHTDNGVTINTSVSIGISLYPMHGEDCDQLYKAADGALYETKERGRDGYTLAELNNEEKAQ